VRKLESELRDERAKKPKVEYIQTTVSTPSYSSYSSSNYNKRCQATTLKGAQCKRNAQSGSSRCWQH